MFEKPKKLFNRYYIVMLLMNVVTPLASYMVMPIMSKYALSKGAALTLAGTVVGLMSIAAMFFRPFSNLTADRINKKHVLMFTSLALCVVSMLYCLVDSIPQMLLLRIVHGCIFSMNSTTFMAYTVRFVPEKQFGEGIGYLSVGQTLASSVGPALGLKLVEQADFFLCFLVSGGLYALAFVLVSIVVPTEVKTSDAPVRSKRISLNDFIALDLLPYTFFICVFSGGNGLASSYLSLIGDSRGIANVGLFFTVDAMLMLLIRPFAGKLTDKKGPLCVLIPAYLCGALAFAVIGIAGSLSLILIAAACKAFSSGAGNPAIQATCLRKAGPQRTGVASGTCYIGQDIGQGLAPVLGAMVAGIGGGTNYGSMCFAASVTFLFVGASFFLFYRRQMKKNRSVKERFAQ